MSQRASFPFHPVRGIIPSFNSTAASTSALFALEATGREWQGPSGRAIRVASLASDDYYINFGSSTIAASTATSLLVLGGTVESFMLDPSDTYVAIKSSTDVLVNITLGYGG